MADKKKKKNTTKKNSSAKSRPSGKTSAKKQSSSRKSATKSAAKSAKSGKKPKTSSSKTVSTDKKVTNNGPSPKTKTVQTKKKHTARNVIIGVSAAAGIIIAALFGNYYYENMLHYQEHFFPGTYINGTDCSEMTVLEASQTIQKRLNQYSFTFTDHEGRSNTITAEEMDVTYSDNGEIEQILSAQDSLKWAFREKEEESFSVTSGYTYNHEKLDDWIFSLPCLCDGIAPTDAFEYMGEDGYWHIEPETYGDYIEPSLVESIVFDAVDNAREAADLEGMDCFVQPAVTSEDADLTASVTEKNDAIDAAIARAAKIDEITNVSLTFNSFIDKAYLDEELLRGMIIDDENGEPIIDPEQVKDWVRSWAQERGLDKETDLFVTHGGRLMKVDNGVLGGWLLDIEATASKAYQFILERDGGILFPVTADADGNLQSDESYVEINIKKQKMWYYLNGEELVETPVVTGDILKGRDTPSNGIWNIYYKTTNYTMHGPRLANGQYEYTAYVSYWMPFNGEIGIHDMTSRDAFGGEIYKGNGSHGCINTPLENVEIIYENAPVGTRVVVHS